MATMLNDRQRTIARLGISLLLLSKKHHQDFANETVAELWPTAKTVRPEKKLGSTEEEMRELIDLLCCESVVCGPVLGDGETEANSELNEALSSLDGVKDTLKQAGFNAGVSGADVPGEDLPGAAKAGG